MRHKRTKRTTTERLLRGFDTCAASRRSLYHTSSFSVVYTPDRLENMFHLDPHSTLVPGCEGLGGILGRLDHDEVAGRKGRSSRQKRLQRKQKPHKKQSDKSLSSSSSGSVLLDFPNENDVATNNHTKHRSSNNGEASNDSSLVDGDLLVSLSRICLDSNHNNGDASANRNKSKTSLEDDSVLVMMSGKENHGNKSKTKREGQKEAKNMDDVGVLGASLGNGSTGNNNNNNNHKPSRRPLLVATKQKQKQNRSSKSRLRRKADRFRKSAVNARSALLGGEAKDDLSSSLSSFSFSYQMLEKEEESMHWEQEQQSQSKPHWKEPKDLTRGKSTNGGVLGGVLRFTPKAKSTRKRQTVVADHTADLTPFLDNQEESDREDPDLVEKGKYDVTFNPFVDVASTPEGLRNSEQLSFKNDGVDTGSNLSSKLFHSPDFIQPRKRIDHKPSPYRMELNSAAESELEGPDAFVTGTKKFLDVEHQQEEMSQPLLPSNQTHEEENEIVFVQDEGEAEKDVSRANHTLVHWALEPTTFSPVTAKQKPDPPTPLVSLHHPSTAQRQRPDPPTLASIQKARDTHLIRPMERTQPTRDPTPCKTELFPLPASWSVEEHESTCPIPVEPNVALEENQIQTPIKTSPMITSPAGSSRSLNVDSSPMKTMDLLGLKESEANVSQYVEEPKPFVPQSPEQWLEELAQSLTPKKAMVEQCERVLVDSPTQQEKEQQSTSDIVPESDPLEVSLTRRSRKQPARFGSYATEQEIERKLNRKKKKSATRKGRRGTVVSKSKAPIVVNPVVSKTHVPPRSPARKVDLDSSMEEFCAGDDDDNLDATNKWPESEVEKLRKAHSKVEPASSFYWDRVASFMEGRTAEECSTKWYSLVATPNPRKKAQQENENKAFQNTSEDHDDFFGNPSPRSRRSSCNVTGDDDTMDFGSAIKFYMPRKHQEETKDVGKTYVNNLKKAVKQDQKKKVKPKRQKPQRSGAVSESVRDGEYEIKGSMTPGGTLKVTQLNSSDDDMDDFWSDAYGSSDAE